MSAQAIGIIACLVLAAFGAGCWLGERDTRKRWQGWRPYRTHDPMRRDYK